MKGDKSEKATKDLIRVPLNGNVLLEEVLRRVNANEELITLWEILNINAIERLGMSDHGSTHFQIVANISLRLARILTKNNVVMSLVKDFKLTNHHAEIVMVLASIMHDLGMSIHRANHEEYSLFLANRLLHEILDFLPINERTIITSETLHAIISHRSDGRPFTIEAGVVRIADALDMSQGRSRIPFEAGAINIHSLSAFAVDHVDIKEGRDRFIHIDIKMNNSSGIFQVDELLKEKLSGSGLEKFFEVRAYIEGDSEKKMIEEHLIKY